MPNTIDHASKCPSCGKLAAVHGRPHCTSPTCTWTRCGCGVTWCRSTGQHHAGIR